MRKLPGGDSTHRRVDATPLANRIYGRAISTMPSFRFTADMHIRRGSDFADLHANGQRVGDGHLLVIGRRNELVKTRIGLSVSRRHGGAVRRNRKRRLLREAFRFVRLRLPTGLDVVLIPRHRDDSTLADFQASLLKLMPRLDRTVPRADPALESRTNT